MRLQNHCLIDFHCQKEDQNKQTGMIPKVTAASQLSNQPGLRESQVLHIEAEYFMNMFFNIYFNMQFHYL